MNSLQIDRQYQAIRGNNFIIFNADFSFFLSFDKEEYDILLAKRIKRIEFHVSHNDYFGTLATSLNLLAQGSTKKQKDFLKGYTDDLVYLQKLYKIIKK